MKKLFTKSNPKLPNTSASKVSSKFSALAAASPFVSKLQKPFVPPVLHPCPHERICLIATSDGLLLRPYNEGLKSHNSHVCVNWGKCPSLREVTSDVSELDWSTGLVVFGIVGIIELFSGSHLLVITERNEVGQLFDSINAIYSIKNVVAIPLYEDRARIALSTIASKNSARVRPVVRQSNTLDTISSAPTKNSTISSTGSDGTAKAHISAPQVQFSFDVIKPSVEQSEDSEMEKEADDYLRVSPVSSGASTPTSECSSTMSPVTSTLANRLSFWSRITKRTPSTQANATSKSEALNSLGDSGEDYQLEEHESTEVIDSILATTAPPPSTAEERHFELEAKIVKECVRDFSKGEMYFAYNFDITRSLQHKREQVLKSKREQIQPGNLNAIGDEKNQSSKDQDKVVKSSSPEEHMQLDRVDILDEPYPTLPLWRRVDRQYWWNEWLSKPFVDAGLHSYILPIMQGHYQISMFPISLPAPRPSKPNSSSASVDDEGNEQQVTMVDYVVISRRSRDRAGLRYQRRGIDDEAHVANWVETESIMRVEREGSWNVFSYVQVRGSIPLFWTQTGAGLKPAPVLSPDRTHQQNLDALKRHFHRTVSRYGAHMAVNLAEQHGKEGAVTTGYREYMREFDSADAQYHEYDFHTETKGMKYENISKLIVAMDQTFDHQGYLWICDSNLMSTQRGVFRINCIDCLDRTNVVQSAFARHVLQNQLGAVALHSPSNGLYSEMDVVFNDLWANNGDAISRAYAGTSALKGDFTRTGKRDLTGLLNDGVNSLARMYTSTFSDWFSQAVIDYILGNRTLAVFSEFLLKLQSSDPRDLIRLSKIRAEAIATCASRVISEGECLLSGWTVFGPSELNSKLAEKFEEKVLLLTADAMYIISYDYTLEKVKVFTRVPLTDITTITKGAYIISPLEETSRDPLQNAGFVVTWQNANQITRMSSYSVRNSVDGASTPPASPMRTSGTFKLQSSPRPLPSRRASKSLSRLISSASSSSVSDKTFAAFKVLPIDPTRVRRGTSSGGSAFVTEQADELSAASTCEEAVDLMVESIRRACRDLKCEVIIGKEDVVSLAEAQRATTMYAKMEYGVKRLLWLGGH